MICGCDRLYFPGRCQDCDHRVEGRQSQRIGKISAVREADRAIGAALDVKSRGFSQPKPVCDGVGVSSSTPAEPPADANREIRDAWIGAGALDEPLDVKLGGERRAQNHVPSEDHDGLRQAGLGGKVPGDRKQTARPGPEQPRVRRLARLDERALLLFGGRAVLLGGAAAEPGAAPWAITAPRASKTVRRTLLRCIRAPCSWRGFTRGPADHTGQPQAEPATRRLLCGPPPWHGSCQRQGQDATTSLSTYAGALGEPARAMVARRGILCRKQLLSDPAGPAFTADGARPPRAGLALRRNLHGRERHRRMLGYLIGYGLFDQLARPVIDFYGYGPKFGGFQGHVTPSGASGSS